MEIATWHWQTLQLKFIGASDPCEFLQDQVAMKAREMILYQKQQINSYCQFSLEDGIVDLDNTKMQDFTNV